MKKLLIIVGCIAVLGVTGSISAYYLYVLPKQQEDKLAFERQKYEEERRSEEEEKQNKKSEERVRELRREACISDAFKNYSSTWTAECIAQAKNNKDLNAKYGWDLNVDSSSDCRLQTERADNLSDVLNRSKDECFKKYPVN